MKSLLKLIIVSVLAVSWVLSARPQQSVSVAGKFTCDGKPAKDVKVKLYDKDTFTFDDLMGKSQSDASGIFKVEGTANEVTNIQPKLNVYHRCNYTPLLPTCYQKFSIRIPSNYITKGPRAAKTFDVGTINLAGKMSGQGTDCLN
ncbi:unnamed protein product [Bursaphelenchus okinawaensis]|uniref:Transthyretin-like family protein n=1 Tax=Bursaphelenchus okinawaensis TaxID=465554 RepID=A0A811K6A0_9BILA|nr:unnamed protein product [Bursaphelenchus okinawaensis]CAG9092302.1 unnamed protein product [Bursaphelenchus okinawaensis]